MNSKKIFSIKQIEIACVIASPIASGLLIANNYRIFGEKNKAVLWIIIGVIWTLILFSLGILIESDSFDKSLTLLPLINGAILYPIIKKLQGKKIEAHIEQAGEKASNWKLAFIISVIVAIMTLLIIGLNKLSPNNNYLRQDFNSSGVFYNPEMPIEEVFKVGDILKRIEYFSPQEPAEVVFLSKDSLYEFKLVVNSKYFDNNEYIGYTKQIFKHINEYNFLKPIIFKFTDSYLIKDKVIELCNYDSIPNLLEIELFARNKNFRLVYEKEFKKSEREKFQDIVMTLSDVFPPNLEIDFRIDIISNKYQLALFIPQDNWINNNLIYSFKRAKVRLNNHGFDKEFVLILVDDTSNEIKEFEIE